jgi:hypothetical protein
MEDKVYWQTKDGKMLDVDDMTDSHVRHAFKILLRRIDRINAQEEKDMLDLNDSFALNGDMAQEFNDTFPGNDEYDDTWVDVSFFDH